MSRAAISPSAILLIGLLLFPSVLRAESSPSPELESILRKIEARHYRWVAIRADVLLFFAKSGDPSAMCGGELLYQRLDERMFLTCADAKQELLFVFRTFDRRFDLYLPSQNTVYHGSIFDMEDSPDIESHLKARDLYRALKPTAVDPRRTQVERTNSAITSLDVYGRNDDEGQLIRKLYVTPEGDVRGELFYGAEGRPVTEIQRYDFQEIRGQTGSYRSMIFPKKVTILSPETRKGSAIFFSKVTPLDMTDPLDFILRVPPGTREVFLDEKKPAASPSAPVSKPLEVLEAPRPLSAPVKNSAPVKKDLEGKSVEKPEEKTAAPAAEERSADLPAEKPAVKPETPPLKTTSQEMPATRTEPAGPAASQTSSSVDAQTTLDPSVDPSL